MELALKFDKIESLREGAKMNKHNLTTKEFLKYFGEQEGIVIKERALRFYVLKGIFPHPAKIGGNKGFYSLDDIPKLKTIIFLKQAGKSIKEIKELIGGDTPVTTEGFQKLEQEVVARIIEALLKGMVDLKSFNEAAWARNLQASLSMLDKIEHWDMRARSSTSYFTFIAGVVKHLRKCMCVIPSNWNRDEFDRLLLDRRYFRMVSVGVASTKRELATSVRVAREINYQKDENIRKAKEKIKSALIELINKHISSLQVNLKAIQNL
jgi:DNA-binding transcriptional MerR regulator